MSAVKMGEFLRELSENGRLETGAQQGPPSQAETRYALEDSVSGSGRILSGLILSLGFGSSHYEPKHGYVCSLLIQIT